MQDFFSYFTPTGSITEGPTPPPKKKTYWWCTQTAVTQDVEVEPPEGPPESQIADLYRPSFCSCNNHYMHVTVIMWTLKIPNTTPSPMFHSAPLKRGATVNLHSTVKKSCLLMCLQFTKIKCINVLVVAHSAKTTGQPRSISGQNICTFTLIIALLLPVSLGRTTRPMAMMTNVFCGCTCKKAQF